MSIFLSEKLYFIFSKYSFLNEKGFENTLIELKINIESNSRGQRENSLFLKGWILADFGSNKLHLAIVNYWNRVDQLINKTNKLN